jgi:hypothetical protein
LVSPQAIENKHFERANTGQLPGLPSEVHAFPSSHVELSGGYNEDPVVATADIRPVGGSA